MWRWRGVDVVLTSGWCGVGVMFAWCLRGVGVVLECGVGVVLVWYWRAVGEWCWSGVGAGLEWCWRGVGVGFGWGRGGVEVVLVWGVDVVLARCSVGFGMV